MTPLVKCHDCDGTGDCPAHIEVYIDVDVTLPCEVCCGTNMCPTCNGKGNVSEYRNYVADPTKDPRD